LSISTIKMLNFKNPHPMGHSISIFFKEIQAVGQHNFKY